MQKLQGRVLILNNSYEPIGTMGLAKAMCKIVRADSSLTVIKWCDDRTLTSPSGEYPVPSILRLNYHVDMIGRRNRSLAKRERIYMRDKFRCQYCGIRMGQKNRLLHGGPRIMTKEDLTLDHIQPSSEHGLTIPSNLVTACKPCNQRKANRTPEQARMPLLTSTTLLKVNLNTIAMCQYAETYAPEWKDYLFLGEKGEESLQHTGELAYG